MVVHEPHCRNLANVYIYLHQVDLSKYEQRLSPDASFFFKCFCIFFYQWLQNTCIIGKAYVSAKLATVLRVFKVQISSLSIGGSL